MRAVKGENARESEVVADLFDLAGLGGPDGSQRGGHGAGALEGVGGDGLILEDRFGEGGQLAHGVVVVDGHRVQHRGGEAAGGVGLEDGHLRVGVVGDDDFRSNCYYPDYSERY